MISILASFVLSLGASAFEGQPKTVTVISGLSQKVAMEFPEITADSLVIEDTKCSESTCSKMVRVKNDLRTQAGNVDYKLLFVFVDINRQGQLVQPLKARAMVFSELETGTRLTFSLGDERRTVCFGASSSSNLCSFYQVHSTY